MQIKTEIFTCISLKQPVHTAELHSIEDFWGWGPYMRFGIWGTMMTLELSSSPQTPLLSNLYHMERIGNLCSITVSSFNILTHFPLGVQRLILSCCCHVCVGSEDRRERSFNYGRNSESWHWNTWRRMRARREREDGKSLEVSGHVHRLGKEHRMGLQRWGHSAAPSLALSFILSATNRWRFTRKKAIMSLSHRHELSSFTFPPK